MSELKNYFHRFRYLTMPPSNFTDDFDVEFESAVMLYQKKLGLSVTGKLDSDTVSTIIAPRCGVSDVASAVYGGSGDVHSTLHFAYYPGKPRWVRDSPMTLTYAFSPELRTAFSRWASVIPVTFVETSDYESSDIRIGFFRRDHGDGAPFNGVLGVLAHAFSPEYGIIHMDADETWAVDFKKEESTVAVDMESVATHEIGHVLGLGHSSVKKAIMYPRFMVRLD